MYSPTSLPTPSEFPALPTPPQSLLHRPPGIPEPWKLPLPSSGSDDSDDGEYEDERMLSYSDTEGERVAKLRYIKRLKKQPPPPPPFIDDKDTDARLLSFSDSEGEREKKLNYLKKYPVRKKLAIPKYKF